MGFIVRDNEDDRWCNRRVERQESMICPPAPGRGERATNVGANP
jgi:hypothetical protein